MHVGWASFTTVLALTAAGDNLDVTIDLCPPCKRVLMDYWLEHGLDWSKTKSVTKYLDVHGQEVLDPESLLGKPMCVYRAAGKVGVRPCRRFKGHAGECSPNPEGVECHACEDGTPYDETDPPTIYGPAALEHHAQTVHGIRMGSDGWYIDTADSLGTFDTLRAALSAVDEVRGGQW